jgi:hypothetical protein
MDFKVFKKLITTLYNYLLFICFVETTWVLILKMLTETPFSVIINFAVDSLKLLTNFENAYDTLLKFFSL